MSLNVCLSFHDVFSSFYFYIYIYIYIYAPWVCCYTASIDEYLQGKLKRNYNELRMLSDAALLF